MEYLNLLLLNQRSLTLLSMALLVGAMTGVLPLWRNTAYAYIPTFVVSLLSLAISFRKMVAQQREQRRAQGRCVKCGYDLRATPGRCPECGSVP